LFKDVRIGLWASRIRQLYYSNTLNKEQIKEFESIKHWTWVIRQSFDDWLDCVKDYVETNNKMPINDTIHNHMKIGNWCNYMRKKYRKKLLTEQEIKILESIDGWFWEKDISFNDKIELVKEYCHKYKKCPTRSTIYKNCNIGSVIGILRKNKKLGKLKQEVIYALEELPGWVWEYKIRNIENFIILYTEYVNEYNKVPLDRIIYKSENLGQWYRQLCDGKKDKTLSEDIIERLEQLPLWTWEKSKNKFQTNVILLEEFIEEFGRLPQQREKYKNIRLGTWRFHLYRSYNKKVLEQYKINRLEQIPEWNWTAK